VIELRTAWSHDRAFAFVNSFRFSADFRLPLIGTLNLGDVVFGLCGGMCYAALDYFHAGLPIPRHAQGPANGTPLYRYLWARQLDSISRPLVLLRLFRWMLHDDDWLHRLTVRHELPALRRRIARGEPAVLLLVRARGISDPTVNHQVAAVAYIEDPATGEVTLPLYDPNHPGAETHITVHPHPAPGRPPLEGSTGEPLRGFFVLSYHPSTRNLPVDA
jgi:hypothetical protein